MSHPYKRPFDHYYNASQESPEDYVPQPRKRPCPDANPPPETLTGHQDMQNNIIPPTIVFAEQAHTMRPPINSYNYANATTVTGDSTRPPMPGIQENWINVQPEYDMAQKVKHLDERTVQHLLACAATYDVHGAIRKNINLAFNAYVARMQAQLYQTHAPYRAMLMQHAPSQQHPESVQASGQTQQQQQLSSGPQQEQGLCFDDRHDKVDHILNDSHYTKLSSSKQYEAAFDAYGEVVAVIKSIRKKAKAYSSYGTKVGALKNLTRIGDTILVSDSSTLGHEVRKEFQYDDCVPSAMLAILKTMTCQDCIRAGQDNQSDDATLLQNVQGVISEAEGYCIGGFDDMSKVIKFLEGKAEYRDAQGHVCAELEDQDSGVLGGDSDQECNSESFEDDQ